MKPSIAIIGAGLAGLTLARELNLHADITVFEKARGIGGRISTRRNEPHQWDHGAQFFTTRTKPFQRLLAPLISSGIVAEWWPTIISLETGDTPVKRPWFEAHYVAVPGMNQLLKAMATDLNIQLNTRVVKLQRRRDKWQLLNEHAELLGEYDWVVSSAPLPQTRALLSAELPDEQFSHYRMLPCYALLLAVDDAVLPDWDAAKVNGAPIRWISLNHRLPGRNPQAGAVVVHSTPEWATAHLEGDQEEVKQQLMTAFCDLSGVTPQSITKSQLHRWRYALSTEVTEPENEFVLDQQQRLAACGDWCLGGRVEAAFTSAFQLAKAIRKQLT